MNISLYIGSLYSTVGYGVSRDVDMSALYVE